MTNDNTYKMRFLREVFIFVVLWILLWAAGAMGGAIAAYIAVAAFLCNIPRFWRACTVYNTEVTYRRKRENIETQLIQGRIDGQIIREAAGDLRREGRL